MTTWTSDELNKIGSADELDITTIRPDGTPRKPVTIWVVRVDGGSVGGLYVRSWKGRGSGWFRGTQRRQDGHIRAGGVDKDVTFVEETNPAINAQIDAAYRKKYGHYDAQYVDPMVVSPAREATIKLVPR